MPNSRKVFSIAQKSVKQVLFSFFFFYSISLCLTTDKFGGSINLICHKLSVLLSRSTFEILKYDFFLHHVYLYACVVLLGYRLTLREK